MKVFLDFDRTLFHTDAFYGRLRACFESATDQSFDEAVWQSSLSEAVALGYTVERHVKELQLSGVEFKKTPDKIVSCLGSLTEFVFPDVRPFLEEAQAKGHALHLLSFGEKSWQQCKVTQAEIDQFFLPEHIHTTNRHGVKVEVLERYCSESECLYVDDKASEVVKAQTHLPDLRAYYINRIPKEVEADLKHPDREVWKRAFQNRQEYNHHALAAVGGCEIISLSEVTLFC